MEPIMIKIAADIVRGCQTGELPPDFTLADFRDLEFLFWCYNNNKNYYTANSTVANYAISLCIKVEERYGIYRIDLGGED